MLGKFIGFAFAGKLITVISGALLVVPVFLLSRKWFNEKIALIAAFLSSMSPEYIYKSSTQVHPQTLGMLLFTFCLFTIYKATIEKHKLSRIISVILVSLLILTYPNFAGYLGIIAGISLLIQDFRSLPVLFTIFIVATLSSWFWIIKFFQANPQPGMLFPFYWPPTHMVLIPFRLGIITIIAALYVFPSEIKKFKSRIWLFSWCTIFLILSFVTVTYPMPPSRFLMYLTTPISILGAIGIYKFLKKHKTFFQKIMVSRTLKIGFVLLCVVVFIFPSVFLIKTVLIEMNSVTPNSYEAYYWMADHLSEKDKIVADADPVTFWYHPTSFIPSSESKQILTSSEIKRELRINNITYVYLQAPWKGFLNSYLKLPMRKTEKIGVNENLLSNFPIVFQNEEIMIYNTSAIV